jgi:hypothetical protein
MPAQQLFTTHFDTIDKGNEATISWLCACVEKARPVEKSSDVDWQASAGQKDAIKDLTCGAWKIEKGSWEDKWHALIAAPVPTPETNDVAQRDFRVESAGVAIRLIRIKRDGSSIRKLASFATPSHFHLFDPETGLWRSSASEASDLFSRHMSQSYGKYQAASFESRIVQPKTRYRWWHRDDLNTWPLARYGIPRPPSTLIDRIGALLVTGNVSFDEQHGTLWAKAVILMLLQRYPNRVKAVFLEHGGKTRIYCDPANCRDYFIGFNGFGNEAIYRTAELIKAILVANRTPVFLADRLRKKLQPHDEPTFQIPFGGPYWEKGNITLGKMRNDRYGASNGEDMAIRNHNMAKIFTSLASNHGCIILNGSDHLLRDADPGAKGQIEHSYDYISTLCGIRNVFDFSEIDRANQPSLPASFVLSRT